MAAAREPRTTHGRLAIGCGGPAVTTTRLQDVHS